MEVIILWTSPLRRRPALDGWSGVDRLEPAFHVRELIERDALPLVACGPGKSGDVGDGVLIGGEELARLEPLVEHAREPARFLGVALDAIYTPSSMCLRKSAN